ncbi:MAG: hypothetical protein PVI23_08595 [Maricaulaceae bacterium]|jgi:hypothetical protein
MAAARAIDRPTSAASPLIGKSSAARPFRGAKPKWERIEAHPDVDGKTAAAPAEVRKRNVCRRFIRIEASF